MSKLKAVDPKAAEPSKPKILVYGKPGVGKTWTALDFPKVFYIDTEGGADLAHYTDKLKKAGGVYFGPDQGSLDFIEVIGQIQALATEDHPYKTVVIDSFTKLFNLSVANEAERLGDKNAFGADKKPAISQTRRLINWLTRLDMNVVLICHEKPQWGVDSKGERSEIGTTFDGWDKLEYELHLCLNIIKAGANRLARVRKTRLTGFPDGESFPWSYDEFAARFGKDVIERKGEKIKLADDKQVAEIKRLLDLVKLPDDWVEKTLAKAGVDTLAELNNDQATKTITFLKGKLQ
ncbi:unnamed protein product [Sphagnum jensenii]|uniref:Uncharacterized protein n=1 Tax=Sphagnum jensenii TaxID=128206 RepID=A0ABP0V5W3_9BRYO